MARAIHAARYMPATLAVIACLSAARRSLENPDHDQHDEAPDHEREQDVLEDERAHQACSCSMALRSR
jgi:hypothetical protein